MTKNALPCSSDISDSTFHNHYTTFLTVFVEVNGLVDVLGVLLRAGVAGESVHGVDDDAVVVDLACLVEVPQVVEADLAVLRQEEPAELARDAHVDVAQPPVHVHKHDVIVEDEQVHDQQAQVDYECQEEAHEARVGIRLPIVEVELEEVARPVLRREVYHRDQEEVEDSREAVPRDELAERDREAVDVLLRHVADPHKQQENQRVRQGSKCHNRHFLADIPEGVLNLDLVPHELHLDDRCIHDLQKDVLAEVVNGHAQPQDQVCNKQCE